LQAEAQPSPDYCVPRHAIKHQLSPDSRCNACKKPIRKDGSSAIACGNPHCAIYMIPTESVEIFTSAMNEKNDDEVKDVSSFESGLGLATRDKAVDSFSRDYSDDRLEWDFQAAPSMDTSLGRQSEDSFTYSRQGKASSSASARNEKHDDEVKDVKSFESGLALTTSDKAVDSLSRVCSNDRLAWNFRSAPSTDTLGRQREGSDTYSRQGKESSFASFSEDLDSRAGTADSFRSVHSDSVNVLLSRMSDTRRKLGSNGIAMDKSMEKKTDMAQLIDRMASAAVAIKDLEQSVFDAEDSSPQRSRFGRPPTSPRRARLPRRDSDSDVRWF